jgi:gliding motility-associated-like protein
VYSGENKIGTSNLASSPFLSTEGSDNAVTLTWIAEVPWSNYKYYIQKEDVNNPGEFVLMDSTNSLSYVESGLTNGRTYCYRIITYGTYTDTGFVLPLKNWSQIICGVPVDKTPPCPPKINVKADCENILNTITISGLSRPCFDDAIEYRIFYAAQKNNPLDSIATILQRNDTVFMHNNDSISIAGCYSIAAVDSFGNVSDFSDTICVDNCPNYELPNVFTPNFDNVNDLLIPFPFKYIKDIDLQIYDRWGALVFKTTDKKILWDGTNQTTKKKCDDGVYYYVCYVNEIRLEPKDSILLKGFIHMMGSSQNQNK